MKASKKYIHFTFLGVGWNIVDLREAAKKINLLLMAGPLRGGGGKGPGL